MWDKLWRVFDRSDRQRIEEELRTLRAEVDAQVTQRTAELERSNAALRSEIEVRERFEQALFSSREWFEVTLASIADAVIVADNEGRVTFLNQAARNLTGRHNNVRGQPAGWIFEFVDESTGQSLGNPLESVLEMGAAGEPGRNAVLIAADGSRRLIDEHASPIRDAEGRLIGAVLVFRDVTQQKQAAEALRDADRRKDEFLAMLGHELRNPLSGIAGAVQVLALVGPNEGDAFEMRQIIERQTQHMSRMIDDLLDVSRISRGKIQLRPEPLDLVQLVRDTVDDLRTALRDSSLELKLIVPDHALPMQGDPTRLAQALVNLVQNAEKFTDSGGRVTVGVTCDEERQMAIVTVADTGIGLPPDMVHRIFEPFNQVEQSIDRSRGGLGLGLALVKGIVEMHGGKVSAASAGIGRGSEFSIRLPLAASSP